MPRMQTTLITASPSAPASTAPLANTSRGARLARVSLVAGVLLLGSCLRLLGVKMGLPYHHHWDEGFVVDSTARMLRHGDDVPASYQYGAPLSRLTEFAFLWWQNMTGVRRELTNVDAQTTLYLLARLASVAISSSGVVAVYWAARQLRVGARCSFHTSLAAALLYAVSWQLVLHARFGVTDSAVVALAAWTLASAGAFLRTRRLAWGVVSVLLAGVAFSFKAPGIVTSFVPLTALILPEGWPSGRRRTLAHRLTLVASVPLIAGCYVFFNPHVLDRSADAMRDLVGRYRQTRDGGFSSVYLREPGLEHLRSALWAIATRFASRSRAVSVVVTLISLWGIARQLRRGDRLMLIAAAHATLVILAVAVPNRAFLLRNYIVVMPCMCLGFGSGLVSLWVTARARLERDGRRSQVALTLIGGTAMSLLVAIALYDSAYAEKLDRDPRTSAIAWISEHASTAKAATVGVTPSVFGKQVLNGYPELAEILARPNITVLSPELETCPQASDGPDYVIDATYRDAHRADPRDPWQGLWLFQECPGYAAVARFGSNPHEVDIEAYPTWLGRVSATVLQRVADR
jgi:hypothetical protein